MKTNNGLRNGSLYFNLESNRTERMLGKINEQRVWTSYHESQPLAVRVKNLRYANKEEVNNYLGIVEKLVLST